MLSLASHGIQYIVENIFKQSLYIDLAARVPSVDYDPFHGNLFEVYSLHVTIYRLWKIWSLVCVAMNYPISCVFWFGKYYS